MDLPGSLGVIRDWAFNKCSSLTNVTLHEGTETIGSCCFRECSNLTSINFPSTLKEIGSFSFQYDSELAIPLDFPEGLTSLGDVAFGDCSSIITANIPGTIANIPFQGFYGCSSLAKVTIGEGVVSIGGQAFYQCNHLDTLILKCTIPPDLGSVMDHVFSDFYVTVVVPCSTAVLYQNYAIWELFSEIIEDCGVGVPENELPAVNIHVESDRIVVEGAEDETVRVFDITGRLIRNEALPAGVYLVQIGNRPAQKVVVHPNM